MKKLFVLLFAIAFFIPSLRAEYRTVRVEAPFAMSDLLEFVYPDKDFPITKYGAKKGPRNINTKAIAKAIDACHRAGGGRVVIPAGEWTTGPIHLKSNVNLHLAEGAVVRFTDNPADYLPEVMTSWEGMECYNYSPLVYALDCENIAITGTGTLAPVMDLWKVWFKRPAPHMEALKQLYTMASTDVPVEQRRMARGENNMRPHLIHLNRCRNVMLDGFKIRESPFWTIHLYMCDGAIARNLDVRAKGHNNDGIDIEMTANVLVENCTFDQGDDAVVIKSGRNRDAWRLDTPTQNVVVRNCKVLAGHVLLGIGSEISGGVRNVFAEDIRILHASSALYFKSNLDRGGCIEGIRIRRVEVDRTSGPLIRFEPDYKSESSANHPTRFRDFVIERVRARRIGGIGIDIGGFEQLPVRDVTIRDLKIDEAATPLRIRNTEALRLERVTINGIRRDQTR